MYHIGLSRDEVDRVEQLIEHLDAQPLSSAACRREHPRIDFRHPLWLNLPTEPGRPWIHIYSRNLSTSGLAFLSKKLFYVEQHLILSHEFMESCPQLVLGRVCFCRTVDRNIQEIGLNFVVSQKDPEKLRKIPTTWLALVLQNDWLARQKFPLSA